MPKDKCQIEDRAILAAQYFIWKNQTDPKPTGVDKLKLQKLLYYGQAWSLVLNNKTIFADDIEAWVHGPAIPKVYRYFKEFNFFNPETDYSAKDFNTFSKDDLLVLDEIWRVYGKYDGRYLEALTHSELPWQEARAGLNSVEPSQNIVSIDRMREYYGAKIKASQLA